MDTQKASQQQQEASEEDDDVIDHALYAPLTGGNELYNRWKANQSQLPPDFGKLFEPDLDEQHRGDLFEAEDEEAQEKYAWAVPDERALRICAHFAPLVEMGAGAGYWARLLRERGVAITAYDKDVDVNCKAAGVSARPFTKVEKGGPETLALFPNATLLLIYPMIMSKVTKS
ncbi:unknown protein [Seminavis robusta]|uniref:Uncharacterized protein n=1 Tax=Seminavis robusta TaxID=568900 RepID=A0A9N8HTF3_9STRA|nr:unknown protein [Seminavis robusta]|eukprot:Sro1870_g302700.1 n/a (173) ;mRNA; f:5879-6688